MPIALIAAAAGKNLVIGKDGNLPWHFSADLKFFKQTTLNHTVLMGRKTWQSILKRLGKPLPGRRSIILTRDPTFKDDRAIVIHDLSALPKTGKDEWLFVIGGAEVFRQMMDKADALYMTFIDKDYAGDVFFPPIDPQKWRLANERKQAENGSTLQFCVYERI